MSSDRKDDRDAHLLAALRHAPDRDVSPPPALSAAILKQAREAAVMHQQSVRPEPVEGSWVRINASTSSARPFDTSGRTDGWWAGLKDGFSALLQPAPAAAFGTLAVAGIVGLMWATQQPPGVVADDMPVAQAPAIPAAAAASTTAPVAVVQSQALPEPTAQTVAPPPTKQPKPALPQRAAPPPAPAAPRAKATPADKNADRLAHIEQRAAAPAAEAAPPSPPPAPAPAAREAVAPAAPTSVTLSGTPMPAPPPAPNPAPAPAAKAAAPAMSRAAPGAEAAAASNSADLALRRDRSAFSAAFVAEDPLRRWTALINNAAAGELTWRHGGKTFAHSDAQRRWWASLLAATQGRWFPSAVAMTATPWLTLDAPQQGSLAFWLTADGVVVQTGQGVWKAVLPQATRDQWEAATAQW